MRGPDLGHAKHGDHPDVAIATRAGADVDIAGPIKDKMMSKPQTFRRTKHGDHPHVAIATRAIARAR
jgi:hypothetical protein